MQRDIKLGLVVGLVLLVLCGFFYMKMRATGTGPEQTTDSGYGDILGTETQKPTGPVLPEAVKPQLPEPIPDEPSRKEENAFRDVPPVTETPAVEETDNTKLTLLPAKKTEEEKIEDEVKDNLETAPAVPAVPTFPARQTEKGDAPAPPTPFAPIGGEREYEVQSGDTLSEIASEELGSAKHWKKIFAANKDKLDSPNDLKVGMTLIIPDLTAEETKPAPAVEPALVPPVIGEKANDVKEEAEGDGGVHVVKKGETLSDIAGEYLGSKNKWKVIAKANPDVDPNKIRPGQKIRIPRDE